MNIFTKYFRQKDKIIAQNEATNIMLLALLKATVNASCHNMQGHRSYVDDQRSYLTNCITELDKLNK